MISPATKLIIERFARATLVMGNWLLTMAKRENADPEMIAEVEGHVKELEEMVKHL